MFEWFISFLITILIIWIVGCFLDYHEHPIFYKWDNRKNWNLGSKIIVATIYIITSIISIWIFILLISVVKYVLFN